MSALPLSTGFSQVFSGHSGEDNPKMDSQSRLAEEIKAELDTFEGESSFKRLFWELLSYDRVREPLSLSLLPAHVTTLVVGLEVFAASEALTVVYAITGGSTEARRVEQLAWGLKRSIPNCIVLLFDQSKWVLVYPDEENKPRVRVQPIPGPQEARLTTARALVALSATDPLSDEAFDFLELAEKLDTFYPGAMPRLSDCFDDVEQLMRYANPEVRHLLPFIRDVAKYPLLTPAQERGEDAFGWMRPPDGSDWNFQQWRLVVHNLRLVLWMARRVPRVGMELSDLVQEGTIGLIIAARKYNPNLGFRFTTYAFHWIRQTMYRALHNNWNLIRWPIWKAGELIAANLKGRDGHLPPGQRAIEFIPWRLQLASLPPVNPMRRIVALERREAIARALNKLKPRQREVIARRYGIGFDHEHTLEEIGEQLGLTRERVRQIEERGLDWLVLHSRNDLQAHSENPYGEPPRAKAAKLRQALRSWNFARVWRALSYGEEI